MKKGILFYKEYKNNAETDIQKIIFEIGLINKTLQIYWDKIFKFWKFIDNSLIINKEEISLDIIDDNSLCLIVLGYQLFPNGTMQQELYERLEIVLKIAKKYVNSYIAVSGGPTAEKNKNVTEGKLMYKWLIENGISKERIIIDEKSMNTVENAKNIYNILSISYKQIKKLIIISSDYHIKRANFLFNIQILKSYYYENGPLLEIISNFASKISEKNESDNLFVLNIANLTGITINLEKAPNLTILKEIIVQPIQYYYFVGEKPKFKIVALYNNNFTRDVSNEIIIENFNDKKIGKQDIIIRYKENEINLFKIIEIFFIK